MIHALAFIETPSSLSQTADLRRNPKPIELPCGATETLELLCIIVFTVDFVAKVCSFNRFMRISYVHLHYIFFMNGRTEIKSC